MKKLSFFPILLISLFTMGQGKKTLPRNYDGGYYYPTGNHGLVPGDTVVLSGNYAYALFEKVNGTAAKPIVFWVQEATHVGTNGSYGLLVQNSSFFKILGNNKGKFGGTSSAKYLGQGIGLLNSSDYEVANCEVQFVQVGFYSNGDGYHMKNILIHDNIGHDIDNPAEGGRSEFLYFGNTGINTTKRFSFTNIKIYNNRIYKLSGDGIQLALAVNYEVYNNTIENYGYAKMAYQNKGIIIGSGGSGKVYNNTVSNGTGSPFQCFGATNYFYNNTAINTCQMANEDAFYIGNRTPDSATVVYIYGNKIDKTSRDFIRKEGNETVYQSGNQFGTPVPPVSTPPVSTPVDSVTKASYDSLQVILTGVRAQLAEAQQRQAACETFKKSLINFIKE